MTGGSITEGVIWKQLLRFFFPILLGTFFQQLYNTVDAVIVGNFVGKEALAAVGGSTGTLINLLIGFFTGLASGGSVIIAQFYGGGRKEETSKAVQSFNARRETAPAPRSKTETERIQNSLRLTKRRRP